MNLLVHVSSGEYEGKQYSFPYDATTTLNDLKRIAQVEFPNKNIKLHVKDDKPISLCPQSLSLYGDKLVKSVFPFAEIVPISVTDYGPIYTVRVNGFEETKLYSFHSTTPVAVLKTRILNDEQGKKTLCEDDVAFYLDGSEKELDENMSLSQAGLENASTVNLIEKVHGGSKIVGSTVDVFNDKAMRTGHFRPAPRWRNIGAGLATEGICLNRNCEAFNQNVLANHRIGTFNIEGIKSMCPICNMVINAPRIYFALCFYTIRGHASNEAVQRYIPWRRIGHYFQYWDREEAGVKNWTFMQITTRRLELSKPVPNNPAVLEAPIADNCTVCMGGMEPTQNITMLKCCHSFHSACINAWNARNNTMDNCPQCSTSK